MHRPSIAAVALALPLLGGCEAVTEDYREAVAAEQRAESAIDALRAIPEDERTPEQTRLLADITALEEALEAQRKAFGALQPEALVRRGLEGGKDAATGNWFGLLEGIIALGAAAAAAYGGKHLASKDAGKQLADLEERIERTLTPQGIAGLRSSSASKATSDVAKAAQAQRSAEVAQAVAAANKAAYDAAQAQRVAAMQAAGVPTWSAPIAPLSPTSDAMADAVRRAVADVPMPPTN